MMKRMPMGWSWAPRIAQHVSNVLTRGVGVACFFIGGKNVDEFNSNRELFQQRVRHYNVQLDDDTLTPSTRIEMVGLEFDLVDRRYRLQEKWVRQKNFTDIDLRPPDQRTQLVPTLRSSGMGGSRSGFATMETSRMPRRYQSPGEARISGL
jgi:hypothetical protein